MADLDPATIFAPRFNALGAPWAATGSIASMIYGEIRVTHDIDIIIVLGAEAVAALERVFPEDEFYRPPPEYVIVHKLEFFREGGSEKHVRDIQGMLAVTDIDRSFLEKEIAGRGLEEAWREVAKAE
jgi:hypothetical protein